jgi:hypothetical protein
MIDVSMSVDPGQRGQTRSSWRNETSLRGVLRRLIEEHPGASREELKALYFAKVEMVPELVEEAITRAFDNDWLSSHKPTRPRVVQPSPQPDESVQPQPQPDNVQPAVRPQLSAAEKAAKEVAEKAALGTVVTQLKKLVRMELMMPNGKLFGDCSGDDFGAMGGQFTALRKRLGPSGIARERLSEAEVDAFFDAQ